MDVGGDDSAFSEDSEFEEGSSYSVSIFLLSFLHSTRFDVAGSRSSEGEQGSLELPGAELRIEGEFKCATFSFHRYRHFDTIIVSSRLVQNIRLADDSSTVGVLGKEWDLNLNIDEQEIEFRDDLRAASGIGKRRRKVWYCHCPSSGLSNQPTPVIASWPAPGSCAISASQSPHRRRKPSIHRRNDTEEHTNHARSHTNRAPGYVGLVRACQLLP